VVRNDKEASLNIVNDGGTLTGSLDLHDANMQAFYNIESGVTELGTTFSLGRHADSLFENSAVLTAGKWGEVHTSTIVTGKFTSSDLLVVDADQDSGGTVTNDLIVVDVNGKADAIDLGGTVETQWSKTTTLTSGDTGSLKFFASANGEAIDWQSAQAKSNGVIAYTLRGSSGNDEVFLDYAVDYKGGASGFGRNASNTASTSKTR
jgi:hypothetical protein